MRAYLPALMLTKKATKMTPSPSIERTTTGKPVVALISTVKANRQGLGSIMRSRLLVPVAAALVLLSGTLARGADFSVVQGGKDYGGLGVAIRGEIVRGDFDRFKQFLLEGNALKGYANQIWLNSLGGDVVEAMRFADLFDRSGATAYVGPYSKCYSSCVFMFAGAASRTLFPLGELGVHRLVLKSDEIEYAREKAVVIQASEDAYAYLLRQGIPQDIVTKMRETPASEIFVIDFFDARQRRSLDNPAFLDIVEKRCGRMPPEGSLSPADGSLSEEELSTLRKWVVCRGQLRDSNLKEFFRFELAEFLRSGKSIVFPVGSGENAKRAFSEAFAE